MATSIMTRRLPAPQRRLFSFFLLLSMSYILVDYPTFATATAISAVETKTKPSDSAALATIAPTPLAETPSESFSLIKAISPSNVKNALFTWAEKALFYIQEILTGGLLIPQTGSFPYGSPILGEDSLSSETLAFGVQEISYLLTDRFLIYGTNEEDNEKYCHGRREIRNAWLRGLYTVNFTVKGTKRVYAEGKRGEGLWDVIRKGEKIGQVKKIEEKFKPDKYIFYGPDSETNSEGETIGPRPIYTLSGNFIQHRFVMKNEKKQCVAKVRKQLLAIPFFDHYIVRVAPGMDPMLALVCTCVIDQDKEGDMKQAAIDAAKKAKRKFLGIFK